MVLKKSNSLLNSGATQRVSRGGVTEKSYNCMRPFNYDENVLYVSFKDQSQQIMKKDDIEQRSLDFRDGLELLQIYLNWDEARLGRLTESGKKPLKIGRQDTFYLNPRELHWFSLNKKQRWLLPEALLDLAAPAIPPCFWLMPTKGKRSPLYYFYKKMEFIEDLTENVDIEVSHEMNGKNNVTSSVAEIHRRWLQETSVQNACDHKKPLKTSQPKKPMKVSHPRGIQRPWMWKTTTPNKREEHDDVLEHEKALPTKAINIHFYGSYQADARDANKNIVLKKYFLRHYNPRKESSKKTKSCVNGRFAAWKGYTQNSLKRDKEDALEELCGQIYMSRSYEDTGISDKVLWESFDNDDCIEEKEEHFSEDMGHSAERGHITLGDFLFTRKPLQKKRNSSLPKQKGKNNSPTSFVTVNPATSERVMKFNKGSLHFMDETDVVEINHNEQSKEHREHQIDEYVIENDPKEETNDETESSTECEAFEISSLNKEIEEHESSFSFVRLDISAIELNTITHLPSEKQHGQCVGQIDGYEVIPCHCKPLCLIVDLKPLWTQVKENFTCNLILKQVFYPSTAHERWEASVKCSNGLDLLPDVSAAFQLSIDSCDCKSVSLSHLIEMANKAAPGAMEAGNRLHAKCSRPETNFRQLHSRVECSLELDKTEICSEEQALCHVLTKDHTVSISNSEKCKTEDKQMQDQEHSEVAECSICLEKLNDKTLNEPSKGISLQPCGHTFCVTCWRMYMYFSMASGSINFTCMNPSCPVIIDESLILILMPFHFVLKWQRSRRSQLLEMSALCKWCPNVNCDKLAVFVKLPLRFGKPILCTCLHSWCLGCQEMPHWPASCDQARAYHTILSKTGSKDIHEHTSYLVKVQNCPSCLYPFQKGAGCDNMTCRLCHSYFTWKAEKDRAVNLRNKLVLHLPIKYFLDSLRQRKGLVKINRLDRQYRAKYLRQWSFNNIPIQSEESQTEGLNLAFDCLSFMKKTRSLLEYVYLLVSFINRKYHEYLMGQTLAIASELEFISCRLEAQMLVKPAKRTLKSKKQILVLLTIGHEKIVDMIGLAPSLQKASVQTDLSWVYSMNPRDYMRYV